MRENAVRSAWTSGGAVVNGWLGIPSSVAAENMAQAGWDSLTVDLQHGLVDYQAAVAMLQAITTTATVPMCRVPWNEPGIIGKMLDAGSYGIICPMVNTVAEARALVDACRYPPQGNRSFGPLRATWYGGADYFAHANDTVLVIPMIETRTAVENVDAIMATPGIDGCYIGPADLGISFGYGPKADRDEPELVAVIDTILAAAKKHGKSAGIHCGSTAYARQMIEKGFQLTTIQADNLLLANAAKAAVAAMRGDGGAPAGASGPY